MRNKVSIWEQQAKIRAELRELRKEVKNPFIIALFSFLLALLIFSGPIVILVNCLIFNDFRFLISYALDFCIFGIIYLTVVFNSNFIADKKVQGMGIYHLANFMMYLVGFIAVIIFLYIF
ncbi:MAG: hypothetical protein K2I42_01885 [Anaeroplasmataceae bacterium]|nr:hypothetical protein [Anaeroplasmataceae bacterium]